MKCYLCGRRLNKEQLRYIIKIQTYAAYDTLEVTIYDLLRDYQAEIEKLLDEINRRDAKELEEQIFKNFEFCMCKVCRDEYIKDPVGKQRAKKKKKRSKKAL